MRNDPVVGRSKAYRLTVERLVGQARTTWADHRYQTSAMANMKRARDEIAKQDHTRPAG